ncbi:hypothetical protein [Azonexus hydrophilus]|uniref:Uncharacterized protein n=1 Tax=Azonexus hydrophilus TaxID=418702 RepID=A0ABZ2XLB5_9RHOO
MSKFPNALAEVDQVLARLRQMNGDSVTLSREDAGWLLAEIDGGREAFGAVVQKKNGLEQQVKQMRRTIDDLSALLRKK